MSSSTFIKLESSLVLVSTVTLRDFTQTLARTRPRFWRTGRNTERPLSDVLEAVIIKQLEICCLSLFKPNLSVCILNLGLMIIIISYCPYCSFIVLTIVIVRLINKIICQKKKFLIVSSFPVKQRREKVFTRLFSGRQTTRDRQI